MELRHLWLGDFRNYAVAEIEPASRLTLVVGANGEGKTNLVEAITYLATLQSFRGAPGDALIRDGCERAVVRGEVDQAGRSVLIEVELAAAGGRRVQLNRQALARSRDVFEAFRVTLFSPDDLDLVKGGPNGRRRFLDELLVGLSPTVADVRVEVDRVLRQRNTLLRQAGGRLGENVASTLDVWDQKLAEAGTVLGDRRADVVEQVEPLLSEAYEDVSGASGATALTYDAPWRTEGLAAALAHRRGEDLKRRTTTIGPQRDEVGIVLDGRPARVYASQGEQRSLALALRLASHRMIGEVVDSAPVLVLDDVFSELDPERTRRLIKNLPQGQTLVTTAGDIPPGIEPQRVIRVAGGTLETS